VKKSAMYATAKRLLDVLGAATALVLFAPLLLPIAIAVRWRMGSPVLFRHRRPGLGERPFECLKFRTMTDERDGKGALLDDERRLTPLGEFLRRYSLDEFPQFWNVLKGEMSLIGPRPLEMRYLPRYNAEQRRRHQVKPGITGWAQVNGRNAIDWDRKFALDLWYVDHAGLWLDIRILALTIWRVVSADGISQAGHATASEFRGTEPAQNA
jgi:sugar transferase EpsL